MLFIIRYKNLLIAAFLLNLFLWQSATDVMSAELLPVPFISEISDYFQLLAVSKYTGRKKYMRKKKWVPKVKYPEIRTDMISIGGSYFRYQYDAKDFESTENAEYALLYSRIQFRIHYLLLVFMAEGTSVKSNYTVKQPDETELQDKLKNDMLRFENTTGFTYAVNRYFLFTAPYIGIGYRFWLRRGDFFGEEFNDRYEWYYVPVGFRLRVQPFNGFLIGLDASLRPILAGRATIFREKNYDSGNEDVPVDTYPIFKLKRGWCYRGELDLEFYFGDTFGMTLTPWYDYASMGQLESKVINFVNEIRISRMIIESYGIRLVFNIYL